MIKFLNEFISEVQQSDEIELYNEAGLQHEMAVFFRNHDISSKYKIQLERNIEHAIPSNLHKDQFAKKEMDIYIVNREDASEKCCIEIKFVIGRNVPNRIYQAFKDVQFLEQLKEKASFNKCYLLFLTPKTLFWQTKKGIYPVDSLYESFRGDEVLFKTLSKSNLQHFVQNKMKIGEEEFFLNKQYRAKWDKLKEQNGDQWRYFLVGI